MRVLLDDIVVSKAIGKTHAIQICTREFGKNIQSGTQLSQGYIYIAIFGGGKARKGLGKLMETSGEHESVKITRLLSGGTSREKYRCIRQSYVEIAIV